MNNGFGTTCYFGKLDTNISQSLLNGSVIKFSLTPTSKKTVTMNGNNDAVRVDFTDRAITYDCEVLLYGSGSAIATVNDGDYVTVTTPWTAQVSGTFYVEGFKPEFAPDKSATATFKATKHIHADGTTLP